MLFYLIIIIAKLANTALRLKSGQFGTYYYIYDV